MSFAETLRSELARRLVSKRVVSREYYAYDASADPLFEKKHPRDHGKFTSKHKAVMSTALARTGKFEHAPVSVELKEHPAGKHRGFAVHWTENGQTTVHAPKIGLQHRDAISHAVNKMWRLHGSKDAPEQAQDSEPKPPTPGFTGMAPPDSLGRVYYWENGKRVANPNAIEGVTQEKGGSHGVLEDSSGGSGGGGVHAGPPVGTTAREPLGNGPAEGLGRTESQRQPTGLPDNRDGGGGEAIAGRDRGRGRPGGDAGTGDGGIVGAGDGRPGRSTGLDGGRGERDGDSGSGEGPSEARGEQGQVAAVLQQRPTPKAPTDLAAGNWRYHTRDFFTGGLKTKAANNIAALRTMREIALEGRTTATPAEQEILSKFVGWGQFPALFHESYSPELKGVISPEELKTESGKWDKERETLQSLMSDDEWESAKGATLNSHYTHPAIVDAHWNMARRLGFTGGKFLETSAGLGYYLGQMPADIAGQTHTTAVELDKTTGAMLDLLYPAANVNIEGFEEHLAPHNFYDLVASNVPFGDYQVHDKDYNKFKAPIHDYFFLKSANLTKPGGLVMHITSTGTMDKPDDRIRKELAKTCDIVAAYRFPGGAHQENAGTQVVTDMVILRKRHPGEQPVSMDETPPEAMPPHKPESLSESLAKAAKATNARRTRIGQALDSLETGHTISANGQKWTLTQVGEDRFWIGGKGGVGLTGSQLLETVGGNTLKGHIGEDILNPEPEPDAEGFTGMTTDSLGRVYHWRDGKRIPGPQWMNVTQVADPDGGEAITVNQYFADHPENILGSLDRSGTMYSGGEKGVSSANAAELTAALGRNVGVVVDDNQRRKFIFTDDGSNVPAAEVRRIGKDNLDRRLKEAIERLPENVLHTSNAPTVEQPEGTLAATSDVVDGAYVVKDGKLYRRDKGALLPQAMNAEATANISGQVAIRAAMMDSLNAQAAGQDATEARKRLNAAYDAYVAKFGPLSATANKKLMKNTPDAGPLLALEQYSPDTNTAKKADMFAQDTVRASAPPGKADNVEDALGISLHRFAKIDVDHMATLLGKDASEVSEELVGRGLAYEDPSAGWVSSDLYLSGNVRRKLIQAKAAAAVDPKYQANVDALLKHQPQDVGFEKIRAKIGAPWVPASDVSEFAAELVGGTPGDIAVDFVPETGEWMVNYSDRKPWLRGSQAAKSWGTPARRFDTLLEAALNDTPVVVRNTEKDIKDGMPAVDAEATEAAQAVVSRMKAEFEDWIWSDEARRTRLHRYYNDNFNNITDIRYNGSHLTLPGMSTRFEGRDFEMRPMQKDFIWRVITSGRGMAGHEVGTGKTSTMVAAAMELRRLGLAKKPAICCLKSNIEQMTREAQEHYPNAKILSLVGNFDAQKRKETVSRIASGDYDMVFLTHDNLEMLPVSPEVQQRFIQEEIDRMEEAAYAAKEEGNKNIVKNIEKRKKSLQTKLKKAIDASSKDNAVTFEQTGIDQLFIDECFPWDTPVITDRGTLPIGQIADEQLDVQVLSCNRETQQLEWKRVTRWHVKPVRELLLKVTHEHGEFVCTANHNIWTQEAGYVPAALLTGEHHLSVVQNDIHGKLGGPEKPKALFSEVFQRGAVDADYQEVRGVRAGVLSTCQARRAPPSLLRQNMLAQVVMEAGGIPQGCCSWHESGGYRGKEDAGIGENEASEPNGTRGNTGEGAAIASRQDVLGTWRKRRANSTAVAIGPYTRVDTGVRDSHQGCKERSCEPAAVLQSGPGAPALENSRGSRWSQPQATQMAISGQAENRRLVGSRVVGVAVYQRAGDARTSDGSRSHCRVYDLEVSGNHNYFAAGVSVSNCHYFKNLPVASKQQMKGIPTADSNRAIDLLMRARYLQERSGGRGLVLATGTPITNTLAELYNFQRFLQPDELKERGIDNFDSWCKVFADSESRIEMKVTGAREAVTRLTRFTNLPELRQIVGQVFDVQRADDQRTPDGGAQIIRPKPSFETHASEPTEGTKRMMDDLYSRGEDLKKKSGPPMKGDDNMLAICTDGRKGAVDLRLLYKDAEDDPGSKANQCVAKVLSVYHGRPNTTQMIFSNVGVHPSNKHDFHLYQDVIDKLVAGGVPREEILDFSNLEGEAKKEAQNALRSGKARIALGSTEKLGTGVNAQHKLSDIHHLDVPWIPTAIEQRNGRGIRQGNMNDPTKAKEDQTVNLHTYVQKGSLDETFWQIVSNKQRFISDYIGGKDNTTRELREDDTEELRPEELAAVASGDPDMLERMRLTQDIERLRRGAARHMRDQDGYRAKVEEMEAALPDLEAAVDDHEQDLKHLQDNEAFNFTVGVRKHTERKTAAPHLEEVSKMVMDRFEQTPSWRRYQLEPENIGVYRGMKVLRNVPGKGAALLLEGPSGRRYEASDTLGSLEAAARGIAKHKARAMDKIPQMRADLEKVRSNIGKPFYGAKDLSMAQLRLAELDAKVTHKPQPTATEGAETAKEPPAAAPKPTVRKEVAAPVSRPDSESEREAAPPPPPAETTGEHPLYRDYEDYVANMKEKGFGARTWQTWIADKEAHDERRKKALAEHEKHPEWKNYKDYVAQMERLRVEGRPFLAWLDWKANAA